MSFPPLDGIVRDAALLFGPPGGGKGTAIRTTQAHFRAQDAHVRVPSLFHFSSGDALRTYTPRSQALAQCWSAALAAMHAGGLADDEAVCLLTEEYLTVAKNDGVRIVTPTTTELMRYNPLTQILISDGFPRTRKQIAYLPRLMQVHVVLAYALEGTTVEIAELQRRSDERRERDLAATGECRPDDLPGVMTGRAGRYVTAQKPLIHHFRNETDYPVVDIDTFAPPRVVADIVIAALTPLVNAKKLGAVPDGLYGSLVQAYSRV